MESEKVENTNLSFMKKDVLIVLLIIITTLFAYIQVESHQFISLDDADYVSANEQVRSGLTIKSLMWAFNFPDKQYWAPVAFISHMLDVEIFGLNPGMHHLMNLFWHIINSLLLFVVLRLMTGTHWRSAFVAGLFALHPVNVDTVAWISERKNLLSTFFWLLSMIFYFYYSKNPDIKKYILLIITIAIGLMAKQMLVTLPFVFLLLDFWPLERVQITLGKDLNASRNKGLQVQFNGIAFSRLILEKVPILILSLFAIIIPLESIKSEGAIVPQSIVPMYLRVENAIVSYILYFWKMVCPYSLTFYYPFPDTIPIWQVVGSAGVLILATIFALKYYRQAPYILFGWLWYLGTIVPVSGIIQGGLWPAIAERWAYVPYIGLFIIISWGISDVSNRWGINKVILPLPAIIVLIVLGLLTWKQAGYWKDDITLYSYGLRINPDNYVALVNLGEAYARKGKYQEAIPYFYKALKVNQNDVLAWINLAAIYNSKKDMDKAKYYYSQILQYFQRYFPNAPNPLVVKAHFSLGEIYANQNALNNAFREFSQVIKMSPKGDAGAYYNIGIISAKMGKESEAINYLSHALKINPKDTDSIIALGVILMNEKRTDEAIGRFGEVLQIDPNNKEARSYLNVALSSKKKSFIMNSSAKDHNVREDDPKALYEAAVANSSKGDFEKALVALNMLRRIQPDNPDVYYNIACIYAKQKKIKESVSWLKKSFDKGFQDIKLLNSDKDLDNIRDSGEYKKLIAQRNDLVR